MLTRLKKSPLGRLLRRLKRYRLLSGPIATLQAIAESEALAFAHYYPANRRHNRHQREVISTFERDTLG